MVMIDRAMKIAPKIPPLHAHSGTREIVAAGGTGSRKRTASATMQMTPRNAVVGAIILAAAGGATIFSLVHRPVARAAERAEVTVAGLIEKAERVHDAAYEADAGVSDMDD
jgi:hypothetical protein